MSLASTLSASIPGNVQKAFLIIHKEDASDVDSAKVMAATQAALQQVTSNAGLGALTKAAGGHAHVMQVQYNPSTLSLQANAEAIPFTYLQKNVDSGIPNQNLRPPMVVLAVELQFDAVNPADAFMMDKARISVGAAASDISGIVQNVRHGGYTVQPQTEGLVAALLRSDTRVVTFRWADMAFTGQLIEVRADYTMFSVSGKPIRSRVFMNIAQQVESGADVSYWSKALDNVFGDGSSAALKGAGQKVSNLLNLDAF